MQKQFEIIKIIFTSNCNHSYLFFFILLSIVFKSSAQFNQNYAQFSIKPHIGFGYNLRRPAVLALGNDVMEVVNKSRYFGELDSPNGNSKIDFRTTHKIGIAADFAINSDLALGADLGRYSQVFIGYSPSKWLNFNDRGETWVDVIKYNTFGFHAKKTWYSYSTYRFIALGLNATLSKQYPFEKNADYTKNGTGVFQEILNERNPLFMNATMGISRKNGRLIPIEHEIILGINLPLTYLAKTSFNYKQNNQLIGTNVVKFSQTALWLEVGFPLAIIRHKTRIINNPQPRQESPIKKPEKEINFEGKKINIGENVVLQNINFEQGSDILTFNSRKELDKLVNLMNQYGSISIIIAGHTSNEGDRNANIKLSKSRAESCKIYLRKEGIRSKRIETRGFGPDFPISKTNNEINRRVEFKIID